MNNLESNIELMNFFKSNQFKKNDEGKYIFQTPKSRIVISKAHEFGNGYIGYHYTSYCFDDYQLNFSGNIFIQDDISKTIKCLKSVLDKHQHAVKKAAENPSALHKTIPFVEAK